MTTLPADPDERAMLAAEYVLGTLDAKSARAFEIAMADDAALCGLVQQWENRLAPLTALAMPEAPPADLWTRIEEALPGAKRPSRLGSIAPSPFLRLWQAWALGATAVAAALALVAIVPPKAEPRMMTVLVSDPNQSAWTAEVEPQGGLRLAAVSSATGQPANKVADGKILQLWGLAPGGTVPVSLGLLPHGANVLRIPVPALRPVGGMEIMISLEPEPANGVAGSAPTGPVVFIGRLSTPGPAI